MKILVACEESQVITKTFRAKAGHYEEYAELIRLKQWGEIEVATHEVAHHIDKKMRMALGKTWRKELALMGKKQALIKELADLDYDQKKHEDFFVVPEE